MLREGDLIARIGGDEFVILLAGDKVDDAATTLRRRLHEIFGEPVATTSGPQQVGASIGIAIAPTPCNVFELLSEADKNMYARKRSRARRSGLRAGPRG